MIEYENLHAHTCLSNAYIGFPDSPAQIEDYLKYYDQLGMKVLSFSEHGFRGDVWKAFDLHKEGQIVVPSAEVYFVPDRTNMDDHRKYHLLLVGKNQEAFYELNEILSEANISGFYKHGRVDFELLRRLNPDNFICTTACVGGILGDTSRETTGYFHTLHDIFKDNFYIEVQPHIQEAQIELNKRAIELSESEHVKLITGIDSHYILKGDRFLRQELQASKGIALDKGEDDWDLFVRTPDELWNEYKEQHVLNNAQIEEAMENTLQAREFTGFSYNSDRKFPVSRPDIPFEERARVYEKLVCDGYIKQFGMPTQEEAKELRKEMNVVLETKSWDYFISLHDALKRGIELGGVITKTSRGSAASFATSAALGFTSINRLHEKVKMYPDRFVSKAKLEKALADIDTNLVDPAPFVQASRELFGEHGCYPMIAIGKMQTLAAFKMLARARDLDPKVSNEVSKQISLYATDRKHAIENNSDDPDYNVDDDVDISNYVDEQYLNLVEDSKQYQKIAVSISPHPCAHLVYNCDLRREIGIISLKPKAGSTERTLCVAIEGGPADAAGYCKQDLLRVAVVDVINKTFAAVGLNTPGVEELKRLVDENPLVWNLYAKGYTLGLNQTEKAATTKKVMRFKPQNQVELAAFIAAIRPGAKSLVDDYVNRNPHTYGIPAMDKMLRLEGATGTTGESSWLFFDENVLHLAEAAGIDPGDAVLLIKSIKKKKFDKVMHYKEAFIPGFTKYLVESENTEPELAAKTANDVWTVIENSASYLFNSSHACAMAYDSLYGAILKLLYPYEFYRTLLQLYTDKGFKDKVALAAVEMRKYRGIQLTIGKFGQDNRDWFIDKKKKTISQALASIKGISQNTAEDLYQAAQIKHDTFVDLLRWLQMNTKVNRGHVETLIQLNYFSSFGRTAKLLKLYKEFYDGDHKITKTIKSFAERLTYLRTIEATTYDRELPLLARLRAENMYTGMCFSEPDPGTDHDKEYLVLDLETKYGVSVKLYNVSTGNVSTVKVRKDAFSINPFDVNDAIKIINWSERARYSYTNGIKRKTGEVDYYLEFYRVFKQSDLDVMEAI